MKTEVSNSSRKLAREGKTNKDTDRYFQNDMQVQAHLNADGEEPVEEQGWGWRRRAEPLSKGFPARKSWANAETW